MCDYIQHLFPVLPIQYQQKKHLSPPPKKKKKKPTNTTPRTSQLPPPLFPLQYPKKSTPGFRPGRSRVPSTGGHCPAYFPWRPWPWSLQNLIAMEHHSWNLGRGRDFFSSRHPGRLTWNLRIHPCKRKIIFQTIIFRFYVNLRGCTRWWLNQPIWKIPVKLDHFPRDRGEH